jgi:hypothetical protein
MHLYLPHGSSAYRRNNTASPETDEVEHLLQVAEARGFPGMLGSIDCMHWQWKKCPVGWRG